MCYNFHVIQYHSILHNLMLLELRVYQMNRFVFVKTQKYVNIRFHLVVHGLSLAYRVILIVGLQGLGLAYLLAWRNLKASTLAIFRFLEKISFKSLVVFRIVKIDTSCYVHGCAIDRFRKTGQWYNFSRRPMRCKICLHTEWIDVNRGINRWS